MANEHETNPVLLLYRIAQLELLEKAMRQELYELRIGAETVHREMRKEIAQEYMTRDQLHNEFISKNEVLVTKREKREWPIIGCATVGAIVALTDLVSRLAG